MASRRTWLERLLPSLGSKIAAAVVLTLLIFGGAFVLMAQRTGFSMLSQQAELRALTMSELMEAMLEHDMLEGRPDHARHVLSGAAGSSLIANAYLVGNDGTILFEALPIHGPRTIPLDLFRDLEGSGGSRYFSLRERDSLFEFVLVPIVKKPQCFSCHRNPERTQGFFAVKLRMDDLRATSSGHRVTNIVMTLATFLGVGAVLFLALSILVIKPIRNLHQHIRTVEREIGHLGKGAQLLFPQFRAPGGSDEIAGLSRDFNALVERLDVAYAELSHLHQAQLEHADRLASTGQMAAGMAHEIKNPVAGVLGALQVFEADMMPEDPRREILGEMKLQLERINHAVNDLLAYARPTPPVLESVQVGRIIERTLALFTPQFRSSRINVSTALQDGGVPVLADPKQLQQVLWNAMLNAVQAMDNDGTLSVSVRRVQDRLDILVSDTGKGIPPENVSRIFEPFFSTKHKGTGLGMTISKRIMDQHGGSITVTSTPGRGTTVCLTLPVLNGEG